MMLVSMPYKVVAMLENRGSVAIALRGREVRYVDKHWSETWYVCEYTYMYVPRCEITSCMRWDKV